MVSKKGDKIITISTPQEVYEPDNTKENTLYFARKTNVLKALENLNQEDPQPGTSSSEKDILQRIENKLDEVIRIQKLEREERKKDTERISAEIRDSKSSNNEEKELKKHFGKRLPLDNDTDLIEFFSDDENSEKLSRYLQKLFSHHTDLIHKGMRRCLSENYISSHLWDNTHSGKKATRKDVPRLFRTFFEHMILEEFEGEVDCTAKDARTKIQRIFTEGAYNSKKRDSEVVTDQAEKKQKSDN